MRLAAILLILIVLSSPPVARAAETGPFQLRRLAEGVHLLSTPPDYVGPAIGNVTIIEQSDGVVLVDSGATLAHGRIVVGQVRALTAKPVKAVMITHWHNDHPLGIAAIRAAWPRLRIISTPATRAGLLGPARTSVGLAWDDRFETRILNEAAASRSQAAALKDSPDPALRARYARFVANLDAFAQGFRGTYLVPPTETFSRALTIDDSLRPVRMMFLGRANTAGDAVAWLPRQRILVTGDIVVSPIPFGFFSYPESWIQVLGRLKAMDFVLLVPGHGEPQGDAAYLDRLIATISDIRSQVAPLARQGLSLDEIRKRMDFSRQSDVFGTTPRLRAAFESLWLTPMVENAWKEANGVPIVQGEGEATPASVQRSRR